MKIKFIHQNLCFYVLNSGPKMPLYILVFILP